MSRWLLSVAAAVAAVAATVTPSGTLPLVSERSWCVPASALQDARFVYRGEGAPVVESLGGL